MSVLRKLMYIAWKNVFRNKRRTFLTFLILILGSSGLILVGGFFASLEEQLRESYVYFQTGHVRVSKQGFFKKGSIEPLDYLIEDYDSVKQFIEDLPTVKYTAPRLSFDGMLSTDNRSMSVLAVGVDPKQEKRMTGSGYEKFSLKSSFLAGEGLDSKDPYGIVIGDGLAEALGLKVGDSISFITTRREGAIDGADFHIRGIFTVGLKDIGDRLIKMPLTTAQEILGIPNQVHSLLIFIESTSQAEGFHDSLQARIADQGLPLEAILWRDQSPLYQQTKDFLDQINHVVQIIISIIFFLSIANTINMALFERMREYGTMLAIGNQPWVVFEVIVIEAGILGLLGACLGLLTGYGMGEFINLAGIPMPPPPLVATSYDLLKVSISSTPRLLLETFAISFLATVLSSILPAIRACRVRIVQALGYV